MIEKALSFFSENEDYLSIHSEINRLISISPSNTNMLTYYYKELIDFLEGKIDVKLVTADESSFALTSKTTIEQDSSFSFFSYKKSTVFVVRENGDESNLFVVELRVTDDGKSFERIIMKILVPRGMTADEFINLWVPPK